MPAATDPVSKQPELKHAAIRVERAELPWRLVLLRAAETAAPEEELLVWRARLAHFLPQFDYAALTLAGRDHPLLALNVAGAEPLADDRLALLVAALDLGDSTVYRDPRRGIVKMARIDAAGDQLKGLLLAGETAAADWLRELMQSGRPLGDLRRWLFAPTAQPPAGLVPAGRTVCNCFGVADTDIKALLGQGLALEQVQAQLKCGSSCGSCLPELRRMAAQAVVTVA